MAPRNPDLSSLVRAGQFSADDPGENELLRQTIRGGTAYLRSFDWCREIKECYVGDIAVGDVVVVLLCRIVPAKEAVDEWLWVVVGDLPPAYIVTDDAPDAASALDAYIGEMERWVDAVRKGQSVAELIPVLTAEGGDVLDPTREHAADLERRLRMLENMFLSGS
jgi:hypothetical protein